ncbi:hypothetical protein KJ797_04210 [Patescibacteria group bacterium]|nr:hypothetical protein [Patescibacteria group bacterium]
MSALQDTNMALTGLEQAHFSKGAGIKGLKEDLTKLFRDAEKYSHADVVVYLGDGGYSRLVINIEKNGEIMVNPSYNSLDEVKEKWEKIQ